MASRSHHVLWRVVEDQDQDTYPKFTTERPIQLKAKVSKSEASHLAISFFALMPLRPPAGSSGFAVTRSILDMMLIHGISRLTIADIADNTPLEITAFRRRVQ